MCSREPCKAPASITLARMPARRYRPLLITLALTAIATLATCLACVGMNVDADFGVFDIDSIGINLCEGSLQLSIGTLGFSHRVDWWSGWDFALPMLPPRLDSSRIVMSNGPNG